MVYLVQSSNVLVADGDLIIGPYSHGHNRFPLYSVSQLASIVIEFRSTGKLQGSMQLCDLKRPAREKITEVSIFTS